MPYADPQKEAECKRRWRAENREKDLASSRDSKRRRRAAERKAKALTPEQRAAEWARRKEAKRQYDIAYRARTAERRAANLRATQPRRTANQAKRRAAKIQATPPWADHEKIAAVYAEAARLTKETGVPHEVDHIYPLQGKDGSRGLHVHYNLQILTEAENARKHNRRPD